MNLHDGAELPILLLGTRDIHTLLTDDRDPEFGQLSSRIGIRCHLLRELFRTGMGGRRLQWISVPELRKIFEHGKVRLDGDAWRTLAQIANFEVGFLRRVRTVVRLAEAIARGAKTNTITVRHLEAAVEMVEGEARRLTVPEPDRQEATA